MLRPTADDEDNAAIGCGLHCVQQTAEPLFAAYSAAQRFFPFLQYSAEQLLFFDLAQPAGNNQRQSKKKVGPENASDFRLFGAGGNKSWQIEKSEITQNSIVFDFSGEIGKSGVYFWIFFGCPGNK